LHLTGGQLGLACQIYGNENRDKLPVVSYSYWPWDVDPKAIDALTSMVFQRNILFCPSFDEFDIDQIWNFAMPAFRVVGTTLTFKGIGIAPTNWNERMTPSLVVTTYTNFLPSSSDRELAADVTLLIGRQNFTQVPCDWIVAGARRNARSAHVSGMLPDECNILFLDGHLGWRKFNRMSIRNQLSSPYFWY
jgi:prepilin-type processing-associated H-X9-DG protein